MTDSPNAASATPAITGRGSAPPRRKGRIPLLAGVLAAVLIAVAGCGGQAPLASYPPHGTWQESFGVLLPGQPAFMQIVVPAPARAVTLESARALPVPGLPDPGTRITRIGVWSLPGGSMFSGWGYPPHGDCATAPRRAIPCRPGWKLPGFRIRAGDPSKLIYYWITAPRRPGNYYLAGLALTYRTSTGTRYTVNLYMLAEYCVARVGNHRHLTARQAFKIENADLNQCGHGGTKQMNKLTSGT